MHVCTHVCLVCVLCVCACMCTHITCNHQRRFQTPFSFALKIIFLRESLSLCVCLYVHVCMEVRVHLCGSQRFLLGVFLDCLHLTFLRQGFSWTWKLLVQLGWLAGKLQGSASLHLPSTGLTAHASMLSFFYECWRSELRSSCLYRKCFTYWVILFINISFITCNNIYLYITTYKYIIFILIDNN